MQHTDDSVLVRKVLLENWEPIVCNEILPDDEYDIYIPKLIAFLEAGASRERIIDYLLFVEGVRMGVETDHERVAKVAHNLIVAWKQRHAAA
ncbi:hypothetical protein Msil_3014 [Methylocella silvestris BL2]|uniref:Uncharacterized protein n=1 Tax=Methylocella silvestris (strain DSM 15510 / CIP 108128 / LMG 27833 / NCIMB 13906 / BL2) TaxID=395965 RepID=B8EKP7_METSB|nr:hypothetical protein [Methylocella silvestris]ACK51925.1 hypothetical protein Msil_3014 [Methylocella silvestris BL2]